MLEISVIRRFINKSTLVILTTLVGFLLVKPAEAQSDQSSYSVLGLGSLNWSGYAQNTAMGGLGISYNSKYFFNDQNPGVLGTNYEAVFQLGTALDIREITNGSDSYRTVTGGFKEFALSAPIVYGKWNFGISMNPYTSVSYGFTQERPAPEGGTTLIDVTGTGGIDMANISTSVRFGNLSIGFKGIYYFGSINNEEKFTLDNPNAIFATTIVNTRRSFSSLGASTGIYYSLPLGERKKLNLGAYYNAKVKLDQTSLVTFENETLGGVRASRDTLEYDIDENLFVNLPQRIGFGISYEKTRALALGFDIQLQNWSDYRDKDGQSENFYGNALRVAIGGEFIPNIEQPTRLFNVTSFRFGLHYEKTPFLINNESVNDIGINFGVSLPLTSFWGLSHLNMGMTIGQRGNISTAGLVRENYLKLNLGFSLQDITWFAKQRFN